MNRIIAFALCIFSLSLSAGAAKNTYQAQQQHADHEAAAAEHHGFGVKAFDLFHDALHPLQHEALPNNNFSVMRAKAPELTAAGEAVTKLGTPKGVKQPASYRKELKKFGKALAKFKTDAQAGTDEALKTSFVAVHDTFEQLAAMLPSS